MDKSSFASSRPVAIWIFTGVLMLLVQVILGGITRLTGSGLSITEWNIVTGTLPPLNTDQWTIEFQKYRQTPQFLLLNSDFNLSDFKFIFFWEWLHRFWARLIAIVFLIPFLIFLIQGRFKKHMILPLITLFLLGALQGAIGWIMVASGLTGDAVYVRPTRLALHFVFALGLIAYAFWFALQLTVPDKQKLYNRSLNTWSWVIIVFLFLQFIYGALMAGHKAATAAPTWPTINGEVIPAGLARFQPAVVNFVENKITIHFIHRLLAYLLLLFTIIWTLKAFRTKQLTAYFRNGRWMPIVIVTLQVLLGIFTVLTSSGIQPGKWVTFDWMALLHQVTGMTFLLVMVWTVYVIRRPQSYI